MNKKEIFDFLNTHPVCCLANVSEGKPKVRGMMIFRSDEKGIIIPTVRMKDLYQQLILNPEVELCFMDVNTFVQIRVGGKVELMDDLQLQNKVLEQRPFIKPLIDKEGFEATPIFCLKNGKATIWDMKTNLDYPKTVIQL